MAQNHRAFSELRALVLKPCLSYHTTKDYIPTRYDSFKDDLSDSDSMFMKAEDLSLNKKKFTLEALTPAQIYLYD